jgi:hypothetical protein
VARLDRMMGAWLALGWSGLRLARTDERREEYAARARRDGLCVESGHGDRLDTVAAWNGGAWQVVRIGKELPCLALWYCLCRPPGPHYLYAGHSLIALQLAMNGDIIDVRSEGADMNRAWAPGVVARWQVVNGRARACRVADVMRLLKSYERSL